MLEGTLRWAFPSAHGDMMKLITLPNIIGEEEDAGDDGCTSIIPIHDSETRGGVSD